MTTIRDLQNAGVAFLAPCVVDINGHPKAKLLSIDGAEHLPVGERMPAAGIGGLGPIRPDELDPVLRPDFDTARILPWDRRIAVVLCDAMDGEQPAERCFRDVLRRQMTAARNVGLTPVVGVEVEVHLFAARPEVGEPVSTISSRGSLLPTPAYDLEVVIDSLSIIDEIVRNARAVGIAVTCAHTEGGPGHYEFTLEPQVADKSADDLVLFRIVVRETAKRAGVHASFMARPHKGAWGLASHINVSAYDCDGANVFEDASRWSPAAMAAVAGLLEHAPALCAVTQPTVNAYKWPALTPRPVAYSHRDRRAVVRLPQERKALEYRAVESANNPYLASAAIVAAALEGVRATADPGPPLEDAPTETVPHLPRTLLEAVDAFELDPLMADVLSSKLVAEYVEMKKREWDDFASQVSGWELSKYS